MLEIKNISKSYQTGDFKQKVLNEVTVSFRKSEFVAILGPSGSGKTTLLNVIGGLDKYDSGDLIINKKSTAYFKLRDWDAYRNNCIGFIFQSYNLINHISVLANVEMSMTLSGISNKTKKRKALEALEKVGIKEHAYKKPNQLSGGQMQRVAIARALVNDPDIILADEPTGALDSKTSVEVMNLIKEIAKEKLVIMVTHNSDLAKEYANRIIELKDGKIISDSNKMTAKDENNSKFKIKKTAMNFFTALALSFNNIKTKKGRTILTAFASSIGIIGIALILSLSNGFDLQINQFEKDSLSSLPIMITEQAMEMNEDTMKQMKEEASDTKNSYPNQTVIYPQNPVKDKMIHTNNLNSDYLKYVKNIDSKLISGLSFNSAMNLNLITKNKDGKYLPIISSASSNDATGPMGSIPTTIFGYLPQTNDDENKYEFMENTYDILYGTLPKNKEELVIIVDNKNRVSTDILKALGFDETKKEISFEELVGKEFKLLKNDDYYKNLGEIFIPNTDYENLYNNENAITLKISAIIRGKEDKKFITSFSSGIGYSNDLVDYIINNNKNSKIVKKQEEINYNVMTNQDFEKDTDKDNMLTYLGANNNPYMIQIFSKDFDTKDEILKYLNKYNENKKTEDKIVYTDAGEMLSSMSGNIMNGVTAVLIAFSAISLIVSSIMIGIITYISVLERTKEIGILRALGARRKDITRVFNAETFIIGITSGLLGIIIARLLLIPANIILYNLVSLENVAVLNPIHAIILIIVSLLLTLIGGFIPAKIASKKDPVVALRTE